MNNLDPLVSTGPSQSHSPRLNRRDTINVRITGDFIELYCENLGGGSEKISANILTEIFLRCFPWGRMCCQITLWTRKLGKKTGGLFFTIHHSR